MHDANGTQLAVGDRVIIPAVIEKLHEGEEYCNVELTTTLGRRPDGDKERVYLAAMNTGVLVKVSGGQVRLDI